MYDMFGSPLTQFQRTNIDHEGTGMFSKAKSQAKIYGEYKYDISPLFEGSSGMECCHLPSPRPCLQTGYQVDDDEDDDDDDV